MSRGPGKMQAFIMETLRLSRTSKSTSFLLEQLQLEKYEASKHHTFEAWKKAWSTPARRRSVRMSVGRSLRQLEAAGQIKRDEEGNWYPSTDWMARDNAERERASTAYHEAGHAVIGLALKMPIAFVTIKPRATYLGHVSQTPIHHSVGKVYARGSYRKPIADVSKQDAFGNPVSERADDWHAEAVMSIAGGMAQTEFLKEGRTWRELASSSDKRSVAFARRKLGNKAHNIEEYEAECEKLIKQHWPLIEAVAEKLLKEETLSGVDVYGICWRVARNVVRRQHLNMAREGGVRRNVNQI
jgi:Peptidase family M41